MIRDVAALTPRAVPTGPLPPPASDRRRFPSISTRSFTAGTYIIIPLYAPAPTTRLRYPAEPERRLDRNIPICACAIRTRSIVPSLNSTLRRASCRPGGQLLELKYDRFNRDGCGQHDRDERENTQRTLLLGEAANCEPASQPIRWPCTRAPGSTAVVK